MFFPSLISERVELRPLRESDADALVIAAADGELWTSPYSVIPSSETIYDYIAVALDAAAAGTALPFVTALKDSQHIIGSTRMWKIDHKNRQLEIGSTWIAKSWQRTFVNTEAKLLMLAYAFETLGCIRVQLTTDVLNLQSRAAILRLGAQEEGVIRYERIMADGRRRDSVRFSIIEEEWPHVKARLTRKLHREEPHPCADINSRS